MSGRSFVRLACHPEEESMAQQHGEGGERHRNREPPTDPLYRRDVHELLRLLRPTPRTTIKRAICMSRPLMSEG
jgi:hypothetical protein